MAQKEVLKLLRQRPHTMKGINDSLGIGFGYVAMTVRLLQAQKLVTVTDLVYSLTDEGRTLAEKFAGEWKP
jgi:predicted transcriptional regulator